MQSGANSAFGRTQDIPGVTPLMLMAFATAHADFSVSDIHLPESRRNAAAPGNYRDF